MGPKHLFRLLPAALCGLSICACAHPPTENNRQPAKEDAVMATPESADNNPISAGEIGQRFLKLIGGLQAEADITESRINEVIGVTLVPNEGKWWYGYKQDLADGWFFVLDFVPASPQRQPRVGLSFDNREDRFADMTAACVSFDEYHKALKAMGFQDSPTVEPRGPDDTVGIVTSWRYFKGDITILMVPQPEAKRPSDKNKHACIKSISTID